MGKLTNVLGINADTIRIRTFTFNGQSLRVRVPTAAEAEALYEKTKEPPSELIYKKYQQIVKPILDKKDILKDSKEFVINDDDVMIQNKSMKEMAKNQAITELRILETFKLLVAGDGGKMEDLTYEDIDQDMPLPIQLDLMRRITEIISPGYEENRKN